MFTAAWNRGADGGRAETAGNYRGPLRAWDPSTGRQICTILTAEDRFDFEEGGTSLKLSSDGQWLAVLSPEAGNRQVRLIQMATGRIVQIADVVAPSNPFHPWRFSADGRWFVCPHQRGDRAGLCVWDLKHDREHAFLSPAYPPFAISPDGAHLISHVGEDWVNSVGIGVWDVPGAKLTGHIDRPDFHGDFGYYKAYSPDGRVIVEVSNYSGKHPVWRWAADTGKPMSPSQPLEVSVLGYGQIVGAADDDGHWSQLDISGAEVKLGPALPIGSGWIVTHAPWCPNGRVAAAWPKQDTPVLADWAFKHHLGWLFPYPGFRVDFYDAVTGRELCQLRLKDGPGFTWAPDGSMVACRLPYGKGVEVWDIPPRKPLTWFAAATGALAVVVAVSARWRSRRLQRKVT